MDENCDGRIVNNRYVGYGRVEEVDPRELPVQGMREEMNLLEESFAEDIAWM